jgi:hypothetical protein
MKDDEDTLAFLLRLNLELADREAKGRVITPPGFPVAAANCSVFVTPDCIHAERKHTKGPHTGKMTTF